MVVVVLLGIPLAVAAQYALERRAAENLQAEADRIASTIDVWVRSGEPVESQRLGQIVSPSRYVEIRAPGSLGQPRDIEGGMVIRLGTLPDESQPMFALVRSERGWQVEVQEAHTELSADILRAQLLIAGAALFAVLVALGLTLITANRLAGPMVDLAEMAERIGSGDPPVRRQYGVGELDRVAGVLEASASRISRMLAAERHFAADASHQLRTPLTALSMRLEEIIETDDLAVVKEEASTALVQVERLTDVVQRVLRRGATGSGVHTGQRMSVDRVVRQQVREWRLAYESQGRAILVEGERGLFGTASAGGIGQVLATLLENALVHGAGTVVVTTVRAGDTIAIKVADEGTGIPRDLGPRVFDRDVSGGSGTGLGLAVARQLAEADGGRLELIQHRPPVFSIFLTAAAEQTAPV